MLRKVAKNFFGLFPRAEKRQKRYPARGSSPWWKMKLRRRRRQALSRPSCSYMYVARHHHLLSTCIFNQSICNKIEDEDEGEVFKSSNNCSASAHRFCLMLQILVCTTLLNRSRGLLHCFDCSDRA